MPRTVLIGPAGLVVLLATAGLLCAQCPIVIRVPADKEFRALPEVLDTLVAQEERMPAFQSTDDLVGVKLSEFADVNWPDGYTFDLPWITLDEDGNRQIQEYPFPRQVVFNLKKGIQYVKEGKLKQARRQFDKMLEEDPRCYAAMAWRGVCLWATGSREEGLAAIEKAREINPYDPGLRWLRGWVLLTSNYKPDAKDDLIEALVLHPRDEDTLELLSDNQSTFEIRLPDSSFIPRALVREKEGKVEVFVHPEGGDHWRAWAACKAVWRLDKDFSRYFIESEEYVWSSLEENECLLLLLRTYLENREKGRAEREPQLERLLEIMEAGYYSEFVLYEIGSRIMPYITLCLEDDRQERMREYVQRYVVRPLY